MPVISKDPIETRPLGMRKQSVYTPPVSPSPAVLARQALDSGLGSASGSLAATPEPEPVSSAAGPVEYERKFVVPADTLAKVLTFKGVERRMVYDTYIAPEHEGRPRLRFRFETSIDPLLGNSENGEHVVAYVDFTVKTGEDPLQRIEDVFPVRFTAADTIGTLNAFNSIYGTRIRTERYRWSAREGNYQFVIYGDGAKTGTTVELEARDSNQAAVDAFKPPKTWIEVTQDKRYSNYSIATYGWPHPAE